MNISISYFFVPFLISILFCCFSQKPIRGDILIKNGNVVDGHGEIQYKSDVLILDNEIIWIGDSEDQDVQGDTIISATGKIVTPGFIDLHAHGNPLETPEFQNFLAMGVTSIALGMDGSSVRSSELNHWINAVDSIKTGVNILPFIGHGTVRTESGIGLSDHPKAVELAYMIELVEAAFQSGCWGLSMGLEYLPGYYADSTELQILSKVTGNYNCIITSHIRNEDDDLIEKSLDEMIALSSDCKVNISHIKVVYGKGKDRAWQILEKIKLANEDGSKVTADLYPYTASYTGIGIVFPQWAKNPKAYKQIKEQRGDELLQFLKNKIIQRNGPAATLFGSGPYKGKTLEDLVNEFQIPYEKILMDIIGPYGASAAYFVMDDELQHFLMLDTSVMIGSDGSPTMRHPRGYGSFAKVIEKYVTQDSILNIEEAVYKMSGLPAQTLGLSDRGVIATGMKADILIFDPKAIRHHATFDQPHQLASGISTVILNGEIVMSRNQLIKRNGRVIRKIETIK